MTTIKPSQQFETKVKEMRKVMDFIIEQMLEEGMTDAEILAMTKLMQEKANQLESDHVDGLVDLIGDDAIGAIMEGTEIFTETSEVYSK